MKLLSEFQEALMEAKGDKDVEIYDGVDCLVDMIPF
jgi:hypothetical protein